MPALVPAPVSGPNARATLTKGRSIGFRLSENASTGLVVSSTRPTAQTKSSERKAQTKRAKGRLFIGSVILSLVGTVAWLLWCELGQFQAYGEIAGNVVHVSVAARGQLVNVSVREGDLVSKGDLLATVDTHELNVERTRLESELQIALATLQVRAAELEARRVQMQGEQLDRQLDFNRFVGDYVSKREQLKEVIRTREMHEALAATDSVSEAELLASQVAHAGLKAQVDTFQSAVKQIGPSLEQFTGLDIDKLNRLERDRIQSIEKQLIEIDRLMKCSEVHAPVSGRIVKRSCNVGENADPSKPIFELLETDSVHAVVYLSQANAHALQPGDIVQLAIPALNSRAAFRIERVAGELVPPPESLRNRYRAGRGVLKVYAWPVENTTTNRTHESHVNQTNTSARIDQLVGAEIGLPRFGNGLIREDH